MAYMRCRFLAVESLSLTRNLVVAPERWLRDIGFHGVAPIIPGYVRDYPNSLGIQVDRPEVPSIGWHLTYARCKREKHGNKKYANAKRGIWTNVREIMVHFISRSPWEHSYDSWIYMTHHLIIVFIIVVAIVFTWCVFWLFGTFLTKNIGNNPYIEIRSNLPIFFHGFIISDFLFGGFVSIFLSCILNSNF